MDASNDWQLKCLTISTRGAHILKTGEFSDCMFLFGNGHNQVTVHAHKTVLAMSSPVFQAMFYGSVAESGVVSIVDIEPDVFKLLLTYIYTDVLEIDSLQKAWKLYFAAKKYMFPHLVEKCVAHISSKLFSENALHTYELAEYYGIKDLMEQSVQIIQKNTKEVLNSSFFIKAKLETVCMILSMDPLNVSSELDLFRALERYAIANKLDSVAPEIHKSKSRKRRYLETLQSQDSQAQLTDDQSRSEATLRFTVQNISNLTVQVYSPLYYVRNLPWQIMVKPNTTIVPGGQLQRTLGVYLMCNNRSKSTCWSCYATAKIVLICHKPQTKSPSWKMGNLFHSKEHDWGFDNVMNWNDLLDPKNGYVKDDSITIEVRVFAEPPHGILGTPKKKTGSINARREDKLTLRNAVRLIRFLTLTPKQFAEVAVNSTLLGKTEERAILVNMLAQKQRVPMPKGFCTSKKRRMKK